MDNPVIAENGNGVAGEQQMENANQETQADSGTPAAVGVGDILGGIGDAPQVPAGDLDAPWGRKADGTPKAKPGRRPKDAPAADAAPGAPAAPAPRRARTKLEAKASEVSSQQIARVLFASFATGMSNLVGPEWNPESQEEADGMRAAIAAYVDAKSEGKLSPEMMLALALAGYTVSRLAHENTQSKFGALFGKMWSAAKSGFKAIFARG